MSALGRVDQDHDDAVMRTALVELGRDARRERLTHLYDLNAREAAETRWRLEHSRPSLLPVLAWRLRRRLELLDLMLATLLEELDELRLEGSDATG
jgi:hypothetical protein